MRARPETNRDEDPNRLETESPAPAGDSLRKRSAGPAGSPRCPG
jgi:hypothetical protein